MSNDIRSVDKTERIKTTSSRNHGLCRGWTRTVAANRVAMLTTPLPARNPNNNNCSCDSAASTQTLAVRLRAFGLVTGWLSWLQS